MKCKFAFSLRNLFFKQSDCRNHCRTLSQTANCSPATPGAAVSLVCCPPNRFEQRRYLPKERRRLSRRRFGATVATSPPSLLLCHSLDLRRLHRRPCRPSASCASRADALRLGSTAAADNAAAVAADAAKAADGGTACHCHDDDDGA